MALEANRLEIAVQNAVFVRVMDRLGNELEVGRRAFWRQRPLGHQPRQRRAVDEVHHQVMLAFVHTDLMHGDDVRMLQSGRSGGFDPEAFDELRSRQRAEREQREGHDPVQAQLPGAIDDAHAAAGDFFEQLVPAKAPHGRIGDAEGRGLHWRSRLPRRAFATSV